MNAHANVFEHPKASESITVDTRPTTMTNRVPWRSETNPQKRAEKTLPNMRDAESRPA